MHHSAELTKDQVDYLLALLIDVIELQSFPLGDGEEEMLQELLGIFTDLA